MEPPEPPVRPIATSIPPTMPAEPVPPKQIEYFGASPALNVPADWTSVEILAMNPHEYWAFIRLLVGIRVFTTLLLCGAGLAIFYVVSQRPSMDTFWIYCIVMLAISIPIDTLRLFRTISVQKRTWQFYRLVISDQGLLVINPLVRHVVRVNRADVARIIETWDTFKVVGSSGINHIVPKRVNSVDKVREMLSQWRPIEQGKGLMGVTSAIGGVLLLSLLSMGFLIVGLMTKDRSVVRWCLIGSCVLSVSLIIYAIRNRSMTKGRKWMSLLNLLSPVYLALRYFLQWW